jgi:putative endonuclease
MIQWRWYVYIIECKDGSYYTGRTWDTAARYEQHLSGKGSRYTAMHGVKRMAYTEEYESFEAASLREKQIQGWTRKKKEKLISGEWQQLG